MPSTPAPRSRSAKTTRKVRLRANAPTHRHRYHSMPSLPSGNSGLFCQLGCHCTVGFFLMIDQRTKNRAFASLYSRAHPSVRAVSRLHPMLAAALLSFAIDHGQRLRSTNTGDIAPNHADNSALAISPFAIPIEYRPLLHPPL